MGLIKELLSIDKDLPVDVDFVVLSASFSIIPLELDGVYPLSQYEAASTVFEEAKDEISTDLVWFVLSKEYKGLIFVYHSLPRSFVEQLQQKLVLEGVLFIPIKIESYNDALKNPGELDAKIRQSIRSLENILSSEKR